MVFDPADVRIKRPPHSGRESLVIAVSDSKHAEKRGARCAAGLLKSRDFDYGLRGGATESRFTST